MKDVELLQSVRKNFRLKTQEEMEGLTGLPQSTISLHLSGKEIKLSKVARKFLMHLLLESSCEKENFQMTIDTDFEGIGAECLGIAEEIGRLQEYAKIYNSAQFENIYRRQMGRIEDLAAGMQTALANYKKWGFLQEGANHGKEN
jgi:hypothetical protein